jgi:flavorubredoxin
METRIDHITGGIYRIATMTDPYGITFNQFLVDDECPTLIHTGDHGMFEPIKAAISQVLDPKRLAYLVLLHWEGDENGGMEPFMRLAPRAELVGSALSIGLNAASFGLYERTRGYQDGQTLELGQHTLRFMETPHVHHWDSMMVVEEASGSLFPSDLFLQPGDQPPIVTENLGDAMIDVYRKIGIFAHENPVRQAVDRIEQLDPAWTLAMHGGALPRAALTPYIDALREQDFAYNGWLLGRPLAPAEATAG